MNYFQPTITIDSDNITDASGVAGVVVEQALPADADRIGFLIQNLSANDLWWGYDGGIEIGKAGYFCITGGDKKPFIAPPNGCWRGAIFIISDGGGRYTLKSWKQESA